MAGGMKKNNPRTSATLGLIICMAFVFGHALPAVGGHQDYEVMSAGTQLLLSGQLQNIDYQYALTEDEKKLWLGPLLELMHENLPVEMRREFITALIYESKRAGLSPELIMAVVHVESRFKKYAISYAGARGFMQVMPFWVETIGAPGHNLFDLKTNLRYGCLILRHYLDMEKGNLTRALARYNGSLGKPDYPDLIFAALARWRVNIQTAREMLEYDEGAQRDYAAGLGES